MGLYVVKDNKQTKRNPIRDIDRDERGRGIRVRRNNEKIANGLSNRKVSTVSQP